MSLPDSSYSPRISIESLLTIVVVIIFCASATLAAFSVINENNELTTKAQSESGGHLILARSYGDFEAVAMAFAADDLGADQAQSKLENSLHYLRTIFDSYLRSESQQDRFTSVESKSFFDGARESFKTLGFIIRNLDTLPEDEARNQVLRELRSMQLVFSYVESGQNSFATEQVYSGKEHLYLFMSVVVMGISGLGLIALLLQKIKRTESAYREKQKITGLLEPRMAAVESSKDGIGITDGKGIIRYVNKSLAHFYGYENADDLIGQSWDVLYGGHQKEWMETEVLPLLKKQGHWQGHCTGRRRDDTEFYQDLAMTFLEDDGWVWIVRDYTDVIEATTISSRRLAAIEMAGDGIGMIDKDGRLTYINRALMDLHGITPAILNDYIGMPWENLYTLKGREEIHNSVMPALRQDGHWKGEAPIKRADDSVLIAEMSLTMLPDGGLIGTARDTTERKQAEEEKDNLQKQFFQAQKMEAIGRLAGGIAHDFNNILASMLGYTEFLMEDIDVESKQHHFARQIMHGGRQAQNLVEQILTFSRRKESARGRLDLSESVSETAVMLRATLPPTISLDFSINVDDANINANATQVSQIIMNLCVNARDSMVDERGVLKVMVERLRGTECRYPALLVDGLPEVNYTPETRFVESGDESTVVLLGSVARDVDYIRLTVSDTGGGMDRQVMEHIFEPFFTTKDLDKGTGLGLSTVHGMMAGHQAALAVSSVAEKGTRFDLYFPAMKTVSTPGSGVANDEAAAADALQNDAAGKKILLVEDDRTVRAMLDQMLVRMGYDVDFCEDGSEAIDHLRENHDKYDLVLSDHMMPNMTGVEMATEIKTDFPDLPVVLISGYSPKKLEDAMTANESIKAVLKKPIMSSKLRQTLESVLKKKVQAA